MKTVRIFHTNDIHSHFEAYPKLETFLKNNREEGPPSITIDVGDNMDRFHPITEATMGKANTSMLNMLQYDYATIGNNEGITMDYESLTSLYEEANFPLLISNLYEKNGERPKWVIPHVIHEVEDKKIGIIGVTVFYEMFYELLGWKMEDPFHSIEASLAQLKKEQVDAIVVISHLGITDDEELARRFPEIDIILGGHTHHVLPTGKLVGSTLLCGAGKHGHYIGEVQLSFHDHGVEKECKLHSLSEVEPSKTMEQTLEKYEIEASIYLNDIVHHLREPIENSWTKPTYLTNLMAESLKEWCEADIGMVNAGVILNDLPAGEVTKGDIHRLCPHPINPCKVIVSGEELKEIVHYAATQEVEQLAVKGLGFRGEVMGYMVYSGLQYSFQEDAEGKKRITRILVNNEPLDLEKEYSLGTIDMFTFGRIFPVLRKAKHKTYFLPELLRDVITWKLQSHN